MSVAVTRRAALLGVVGSALAACGANRTAPVAHGEATTWSSPLEAEGGLAAFLVAGLSVTDLLLAIADGEAPNAASMESRGLLVEGIEATSGVIYTEEELGRELLQSWRPEAVVAPCLSWSEPLPQESGDGCPGELGERWRLLVASALASVSAGSRSVAIADTMLLSLEEAMLIADERQEGYSAAAAAASAQLVRVAVMALDTALGALLSRLDLSAWTVALLSDSEAWPVHGRLDASETGATPLEWHDGGAIVQVRGEVALPANEPWPDTTVGDAPGGAGLRLLAPPGYVFASPGMVMPRATARAGGFLLAVGSGIAGPERLAPMTPGQLTQYLASLAPGGVAT